MERKRRVCPVGAVSNTTTEKCSSFTRLEGRGRGQLGAGEGGGGEGGGAHLITCMKLLASSMPGRESAKSVSSSLASPDSPAGQDREESAG